MKAKLLRAVAGIALLVSAAAGTSLVVGPGEFSEAGIARAATQAAPRQGISAPGVVEPYSKARELAAMTIGTIVAICGEAGTPVKAGEIIAEIDSADLRAQLDAGKSRVMMRESELARLQNGAREEERRAAMAVLADAAAALRLAKSNLDRRIYLTKQGIASEEALGQARADFDLAQARYDQMSQRLTLINAAPRPEDVAIAMANLDAARADVAMFEAQLERTRLRSPIDGVVLQRLKTQGETVTINPPTLIVRVGDVSRLRVRAEIDETDVARVHLGQRAFVTADAYGDRRFAGRVSRVGVALGRKRVWTDAAVEKTDMKILEVMIDLDDEIYLPVGLRVDVMLEPAEDVAGRAAVPAG